MYIVAVVLLFIILYLLIIQLKNNSRISHLEKALEQESEAFYGVLNHANDMIFLYEIDQENKPSHFIFVNRRAMQLLGYDDSFLALTFRDISDPVNYDKVIAYHKSNKLHTGETWEGFLFNEDGYAIPVEIGISTFVLNRKKLGLGIARDITVRRSVEKEIFETKEQLELFWNHSSDALFMINRDGDIEKVNKAYEIMFGWQEKDVLGKHPTSSVIPDDRRQELITIKEKLHHGETIPYYETERIHKNGERLTILASYAPIKDDRGYVIGGVCFYKDITKQKEAETILQVANEQLDKIGAHGRKVTERIFSLAKNLPFQRKKDGRN